MVIHTPRLCNDVAFLPPQKDQPNTISCSPILGSDQIDDYENDVKALHNQATDLSNQAGTPSQTETMVGDIALGAHSTVPLGLKLEKSAIVGGGKETYVDTVASSDGKKPSKEDLEKLGLGDPKLVENLRKKLEEIAKGQEWSLKVYDTPRGREYRGIIGSEEHEGKGEEGREGKDEVGKDEEQGEDGEEREGSKEAYFDLGEV